MSKFFFSIIVPVYNRPDEAGDLLDSLSKQTADGFEVVLVEDGSTRPCAEAVEKYRSSLQINYIVKENSGRSDSRNVGMQNAKGDYFLFFDSDCILPPDYIEIARRTLTTDYADCFGGPDCEHPSFNTMQKAVNYAMTSFWTTGGIRGGKVKMEKFKPRTFNMGFSRQVYDAVGGFKDMYGEDIDLSIRIDKAGFTTKLYRDAFVYHKRRIDLRRFYKQVYIFGQARINLFKMYPESLKLVHLLPACFVTAGGWVVFFTLAVSPLFLLFPAAYMALIFSDALLKTGSWRIASLSVVTSLIQICGYGFGFIRALFQKIILQKGMEDAETLKKVYK